MEQLERDHERFLAILTERISQWRPDSIIGDLFLNKTDFLQNYEVYIQEYPTSIVTTRHFTEKNPSFKAIRDSFEKEQCKTSNLTLESFLIMPVQRMPRYVLLLKELTKFTPEGHADEKLLVAAMSKIQTLLDGFNSKIDEEARTRLKKIIAVEDSIEGIPTSHESLYNPKRVCVREGILTLKVSKKVNETGAGATRGGRGMRAIQKQFYFFMFNDLLICCGRRVEDKEEDANTAGGAVLSAMGGRDKEKEKEKEKEEERRKEFVFATSVYFRDVVNVEDGDGGGGLMGGEGNESPVQYRGGVVNKYSFRLNCENDVWLLIAKNEAQKQEWMTAVMECWKKVNNKK